jgi:hypothetical protein
LANQLTEITRAFAGALSAAMPFSISWDVIRRQPFIDQKKITGPSGDDTASSFVNRVSMLIRCFCPVSSGYSGRSVARGDNDNKNELVHFISAAFQLGQPCFDTH